MAPTKKAPLYVALAQALLHFHDTNAFSGDGKLWNDAAKCSPRDFIGNLRMSLCNWISDHTLKGSGTCLESAWDSHSECQFKPEVIARDKPQERVDALFDYLVTCGGRVSSSSEGGRSLRTLTLDITNFRRFPWYLGMSDTDAYLKHEEEGEEEDDEYDEVEKAEKDLTEEKKEEEKKEEKKEETVEEKKGRLLKNCRRIQRECGEPRFHRTTVQPYLEGKGAVSPEANGFCLVSEVQYLTKEQRLNIPIEVVNQAARHIVQVYVRKTIGEHKKRNVASGVIVEINLDNTRRSVLITNRHCIRDQHLLQECLVWHDKLASYLLNPADLPQVGYCRAAMESLLASSQPEPYQAWVCQPSLYWLDQSATTPFVVGRPLSMTSLDHSVVHIKDRVSPPRYDTSLVTNLSQHLEGEKNSENEWASDLFAALQQETPQFKEAINAARWTLLGDPQSEDDMRPIVEPGKPCFLVSYPSGGKLRVSFGNISEVTVHGVCHTCPSRKGSSGGGLFDSFGSWIGVHYAGKKATKSWRIMDSLEARIRSYDWKYACCAQDICISCEEQPCSVNVNINHFTETCYTETSQTSYETDVCHPTELSVSKLDYLFADLAYHVPALRDSNQTDEMMRKLAPIINAVVQYTRFVFLRLSRANKFLECRLFVRWNWVNATGAVLYLRHTTDPRRLCRKSYKWTKISVHKPN